MITDDSAPKFVSNLIKRGHEAMLEHASFCFIIPYPEWKGLRTIINNLEHSKNFTCYLRFTGNYDRNMVSGNVRAWRDFMKVCYEDMNCLPMYLKNFIESNPILFPEFQKGTMYFGNKDTRMIPVHKKDLKTKDEILTHLDITVRWIVDRGVSHEIVRHRPASFAQESTRYCNYGKDKFGGQISYIIPEFFPEGSPEWDIWKNVMEMCECAYMKMMELGVTPEKARTVLPHSLKTELITTANCGEWIHFFGLRACNYTGKAHPQMLEVSRPLLDDFKNTIKKVFDELTYGE
jgi:thymidylate synthase (FAD)